MFPVSGAPVSSFFIGLPATQATQIITEYFATHGMPTRDTDAPAHRHIPGLLKANIRLGRRINDAEDGQFGPAIEATYGEIELDNSEGRLDELVQKYRADGRRVRLKIGAMETTTLGRRRPQAYQLFETVYTTIARDFFHEENSVRLALSSLRERIGDRMQQATYLGTGGVEGTADMIGRTKPVALGRCLNASPQLLDPSILTFDLNNGRIDSVLLARDRGVLVPFSGQNFSAYAELAAATVPDGTYATSLNAGKLKLGSPPSGRITVDLRGEIDNTNGFYVGNHASIMRMVLRDFGGLTNAELNLDSFDVLNAVQDWEMGLYIEAGQSPRLLDVVDAIAFSAGAIAGQDRSGLFRVQRLEAPAAQPHWIFTDREILLDKFRRERLPYRVPWKLWGVGYAKNWTVMSETDLAANVPADDKAFLTSEYRWAYAQDQTIAQGNITSRIAPLRTALFVSPDGAIAEAARLQALYSYDRARYRFSVKGALFSVELGQTVRIILDRYDLQDGKNFVVVEIYDDADTTESELVVYG